MISHVKAKTPWRLPAQNNTHGRSSHTKMYSPRLSTARYRVGARIALDESGPVAPGDGWLVKGWAM